MHTNEINQEKMTFHLYNYIYKREKKKKNYNITYKNTTNNKE